MSSNAPTQASGIVQHSTCGLVGRRVVGVLVAVAVWLLGVVPAQAQGRAGAGGFTVAPYLIDVTADAATVAFSLPEPLPAEVVVHGGGPPTRFASTEPARSHFVRVSGLSAGRTYRYAVNGGDGAIRTPVGDESFQIRTASLPGESFTFTVYGDPRPGENQSHRHHRLLVEQMLQVEPAFSLVLGDLVDDGSDASQWERFFEIETELRRRAAIFPVIGDNDHAEGRGRVGEFFPVAGSRPYHFVWGGVHFFGMRAWGTRGQQPSAELDQDSEQVRWLTEQLSLPDVARAPFRVVFLHDPIFISRGRASELLQRVWGPLLTNGGVDLVFASWHLYERSRHVGVTYVVSGGAGAELVWLEKDPNYPSQVEAKRHHFCRVDVKPGALQLRAVAEDGTVIDSLTLLPRTGEAGDVRSEQRRAAERLRQELRFGAAEDESRLLLQLFSYDCSYCRRLLERDLPRWAGQYAVPLRVHYYDLGQPGAYDLLVAAGADFGRQNADIPTVFVGRSVLGGEQEIAAGLPTELERFRSDPETYREQAFVAFAQPRDTQTMRVQRFEALSLGVVIAAGLLDGVNPCAFTTIIFLLSYLSLAGGSRRKILAVGGVFTFAVFLTYMLIGVLFYQFASAVMGNRGWATAIQVLLVVGLLVLAGLSTVDAVRCLRGRPTEIALKLPPFLQKRIRARIRSFARNDLAAGTASFSLGVVIASMELACTGQVYLPIVTMIAEPRHRAAATVNLLVYNLAFILPLVVVFLLSAFGLTSQRLARFAGRNVAVVKVGLALLFVALALVVLYNLGWLP